MTLQAVILDVDGTLVLNNDAHAKAWVEAFKDFGYEVSFDKVRPLIGMGGAIDLKTHSINVCFFIPFHGRCSTWGDPKTALPPLSPFP